MILNLILECQRKTSSWKNF